MEYDISNDITNRYEYTCREAGSSVSVERAVVVEDVDELELVAHADLVVIWIVRGRDLHRAGSECHVHNDVVRDNGDAAVQERVLRESTVQMLVARIVRVDRDGRVAEHRLWTCRCDNDLLVCHK